MWGRRKPTNLDRAGTAMLCELLETGLVTAEMSRQLQDAAYRGEPVADAVTKLAADLGVRLRAAGRRTVPRVVPGRWGPVADVYRCPADQHCDREWLKTAGVNPPTCPIAGQPLRRREAT